MTNHVRFVCIPIKEDALARTFNTLHIEIFTIFQSQKEHVNREKDSLLSRDCYLEEEIEDWLKYLRENEDEQIIKNINKCSMTGRPCDDDSFINKLEKLFGRRLRALPWGRPRKTEKTIK